jgi:hypothetical protein
MNHSRIIIRSDSSTAAGNLHRLDLVAGIRDPHGLRGLMGFLMFKAYKGEKYPMIILIISAARSLINRLYAGIALLRPVGIALR